MAAGSRTLKLTILGDVDNLTKSLKTAETDTNTFGSKVEDVSKKVGAAFAAAAVAAGALAVKIGVDGVQAALEDDKAQRILALTLENTTGATKAQITAVEDYITQTALATGVTDDQLRPAFSRLVRSTKDTEEAQNLLNLSLDIASATGKPLETIANSLGKAYDGNTNALGKLGLGIDQSILKTKDFNLVYESLRGSFAGFAEQEANTFQGRLDRLNVAFDEAKETIGFALLPVIEKLITFLSESAFPVFQKIVDSFSNNADGLGGVITSVVNTIQNVATPIFEGLVTAFNYIKDAIAGSKDEFQSFADVVEAIAPVLGTVLGGVITVIGKVASTVITIIGKVAGAVAPVLNTVIDAINLVIDGINLINPGKDIAKLKKIGEGDVKNNGGFSGTTPGGQSFAGTLSVPKIPGVTTKLSSGLTVTTPTGGGGTGGGGTGGGGVQTASKVAAQAAETFTTGALTPYVGAGFSMAQALQNSQPTINLTVNGAIDSEGTARTIVETLNDSYYRGTGGAGSLQIA